MIHEVDEALRLLLIESGVQEGGVDLVFDPPNQDWAARRNAPTVSVFLYAIREDAARRQAGAIEEYDADGMVVARQATPRWFELAYLVTAWTNRPQDEHRLLSEVLRVLVASDALPARLLSGELARLGLPVSIDTAGSGQGMPSVSDVWSALGGELKPSIELRVIAPLSGVRSPAAPPVTEGLVVRATGAADGVRESGAAGDDADAGDAATATGASGDAAGASGGSGDVRDGDAGPGRRLRYRGAGDAGDAGPDGFAAPRDRMLPPGRRRRGGPAR